MPNGHYLPAITCLPLPACHYLPAITCLPLPACHYLPAIPVGDDSSAYSRRERGRLSTSCRAAVEALGYGFRSGGGFGFGRYKISRAYPPAGESFTVYRLRETRKGGAAYHRKFHDYRDFNQLKPAQPQPHSGRVGSERSSGAGG
jgi:hypothetical protein